MSKNIKERKVIHTINHPNITQEILGDGTFVFKDSQGQIHRNNDLPAIIFPNGEKHWYLDGKLNRMEDKPAVIQCKGTLKYYKDGKLHRDNNLPAVIGSDGRREWWVNGKKQPVVRYDLGGAYQDYNLTFIFHPDAIQVVTRAGMVHFLNLQGQLHRDDDQPALISPDGHCWYYKNGKRHRDDDKPAYIDADGTLCFYKDDKLHREGGKPAIIKPNGAKNYFEQGMCYKDNLKNVYNFNSFNEFKAWADAGYPCDENGVCDV